MDDQRTRLSAVVLAAFTVLSAPAVADQEPDAGPEQAAPTPTTHHSASAAGGLSPADTAVELAYRLRLRSELQLGLSARGSFVRTGFVDGFRASNGRSVSGLALVMVPLARRGRLSIDFRGALGARTSDFDESAAPDSVSFVIPSQLGVIANVSFPSVTLRAGWMNVVDVAVAPKGAIDTLGQLLLLGAAVPVSDSLQLYADGETGGVFGYDGDGAKYVTRAAFGLRWVSGQGARTWTNF
jgi:hypothetical protein